MRFANNILDNYFVVEMGFEPWGQLSGMKKLLAKGKNGKFWAKDFGINGGEMNALACLPITVIKPTGVTKEVEIELPCWDFDTQQEKSYKKTVDVKEWELLDYEKLAKAYELIMALITL
jgi:hypothetical protein